MKKLKKSFVIGTTLCILFVLGCGADDNAGKKESDNQESLCQEESKAEEFETMIEEQFHSEYTRTKIDKTVRIFEESQIRGFGADTKYGRIRVKLSPLFDEEGIVRIEYYIDDGNGYFMDTADFMIMKVDEMERRAGAQTTWEENGYHCTLEEQQDIFFTIYYKHNINLAEEQQRILKGNSIRKVSIVVILKYKDGSEKQHRYAFDYKYSEFIQSDNFTNGIIYELTNK